MRRVDRLCKKYQPERMMINLFQQIDVWLKKKGIRKEDQPPVAPDTLADLQAECFATFGTLQETSLKLKSFYKSCILTKSNY